MASPPRTLEHQASFASDTSATSHIALDIAQFAVIRTLGKGSYGEVKLCLDTNTKELRAVKICQKHTMLIENDADVSREIAILKKIVHPNVVRLFDVFDDLAAQRLYMIFEYVEGGPLLDFSVELQPMPEDRAAGLFVQMAAALAYLHLHSVVHRDIKPENIMLNPAGVIKFTDFGVARMAQREKLFDDTQGTPLYWAPEICAGGEFAGPPTDVWALGVTLFNVVTGGYFPFNGATEYQLMHEIVTESVDFPPHIVLSKPLRRLFSRIFDKDPARRVTAAEITSHPWLLMHGHGPRSAAQVPMVTITAEEISQAISTTTRHVMLLVRVMSVFRRKARRARDRVRQQRKELGLSIVASAAPVPMPVPQTPRRPPLTPRMRTSSSLLWHSTCYCDPDEQMVSPELPASNSILGPEAQRVASASVSPDDSESDDDQPEICATISSRAGATLLFSEQQRLAAAALHELQQEAKSFPRTDEPSSPTGHRQHSGELFARQQWLAKEAMQQLECENRRLSSAVVRSRVERDTEDDDDYKPPWLNSVVESHATIFAEQMRLAQQVKAELEEEARISRLNTPNTETQPAPERLLHSPQPESPPRSSPVPPASLPQQHLPLRVVHSFQTVPALRRVVSVQVLTPTTIHPYFPGSHPPALSRSTSFVHLAQTTPTPAYFHPVIGPRKVLPVRLVPPPLVGYIPYHLHPFHPVWLRVPT